MALGGYGPKECAVSPPGLVFRPLCSMNGKARPPVGKRRRRRVAAISTEHLSRLQDRRERDREELDLDDSPEGSDDPLRGMWNAFPELDRDDD